MMFNNKFNRFVFIVLLYRHSVLINTLLLLSAIFLTATFFPTISATSNTLNNITSVNEIDDEDDNGKDDDNDSKDEDDDLQIPPPDLSSIYTGGNETGANQTMQDMGQSANQTGKPPSLDDYSFEKRVIN